MVTLYFVNCLNPVIVNLFEFEPFTVANLWGNTFEDNKGSSFSGDSPQLTVYPKRGPFHDVRDGACNFSFYFTKSESEIVFLYFEFHTCQLTISSPASPACT